MSSKFTFVYYKVMINNINALVTASIIIKPPCSATSALIKVRAH